MAVHSNSSSEIVVKWEPPVRPNGNVTHYIIDVKYQPDVNDRNYCKDGWFINLNLFISFSKACN